MGLIDLIRQHLGMDNEQTIKQSSAPPRQYAPIHDEYNSKGQPTQLVLGVPVADGHVEMRTPESLHYAEQLHTKKPTLPVRPPTPPIQPDRTIPKEWL